MPTAVWVHRGGGPVFSLIFICLWVEVREIFVECSKKPSLSNQFLLQQSQAPTTIAASQFRTCSYSYQAKKRNCFDNKDVIVKESYLASNYNANITIKRVIQKIFWILQTQRIWACESWFWGRDKQLISMLWFFMLLSIGYFRRAVPFYFKENNRSFFSLW